MRTTLGSHTGSVCLGVLIALANSVACGSNAPSISGAPKVGASDASAPTPVLIPSGDDDDGGALADDSSAGDDADVAPTGPDPNGIYVASTGADTALGTSAAPLATAKAGIALATKLGRPLFLCAQSFAESVTITGAISIDGGYDCTNGWAKTTNFARLAPSSGVPLTINSGSAKVSIAHVSATAADNYGPGASSVAVFVANSNAVALQHVQLTSGNAGDGVAPTPPAGATSPAPNGANGASLASFGCSSAIPSGACTLIAAGGDSADTSCYGPGGVGGTGGNAVMGRAAEAGNPGAPAPPIGGAGGPANSIYPGNGQGLPGGQGGDGTPGAPAGSGIGTVTAAGYVASNAGTAGKYAQSGGGGGGGAGGYSGTMGELCETNFLGGGGGQGGFGGCGGNGALGGGGGGASIALLTFNSPIQVADVILNTGAGGNGATSTPGAVGQPGGQGGVGGQGSHGLGGASCTNTSTSGNADNGGAGGRGGKGGAGGPGGGGPSVGILAMNATPSVTSVTYNVGSGGSGGKAITGGDGVDGQIGGLVLLGAK